LKKGFENAVKRLGKSLKIYKNALKIFKKKYKKGFLKNVNTEFKTPNKNKKRGKRYENSRH
jgi:Sec-independent protein translocase protein TatA